MTREEAKNQLDGLLWDIIDRKCGNPLPYLTHEDVEAIKMALAALESQDEWQEYPHCPLCGRGLHCYPGMVVWNCVNSHCDGDEFGVETKHRVVPK